MESKTLEYSGLLSLRGYGEEWEGILFLSTLDEPLAEILEESIAHKQVSARYWITNEECSREKAQEEFAKRLTGCADCYLHAVYTETTGYLWTTGDINIGGHGLLEELESHVGKWLILEIDVHESPPDSEHPA